MLNASLPRYSASATASILVTGGLLVLMQALIATGRTPIVESTHRILPTFVRIIVDPVPPPRKPPKEIAPPEPPPPRTTTDGVIDGKVIVHIQPPTVPGPGKVTRGQAEFSGAPIALVKVAAIYPQAAITRGIEGYVIVEYTVTGSGTVSDVVVLESSHAIFEPNAIAAAEHFRYRPRIVDGQPVTTQGVLNKFTFELED